ncbi:glycoside hydrolase family 3 protein [Flagelloscypha sp. PMI_526]|nr:glycoside hydrolase family 3 protein [Flagelloscypha sp. PMI_526]
MSTPRAASLFLLLVPFFATFSIAQISCIPTLSDSSTSLIESSFVPPSWATTATASAAAAENTQLRTTIPIESQTFVAFPSPTQKSIPGLFDYTDPSKPPPVGSSVIPDFNDAWGNAYKKAKHLISSFSLEQKVNITTGVGWQNGRCVGNIPPVGDKFPGLCLEDSPLGVRFADFVTAFPAAINAAATFNRRLMRLRGFAMGKEHVGKGVNIALGPMMNIGRVAQGGRNWEGFGADPFLSGEAAYETILGMQAAGVQACAKHYINNEQEHKRTTSSSNVDDRTQHEIYLMPFLKSVQAGVASLMCSYNLVNGTYACENDALLNTILKGEMGFQGFVMSDWQATMSTMSAITGLDMTMPGDVSFHIGDSYFGGNLTAFVQNGTLPEDRVDDMATRILAAWYFLKQDHPSYPRTNFDAFLPDNEATNDHIDVQEDHYKLVREIGAASTVLLKNVDKALPLKKPRTMVLIGSDASPGKVSGPNQFADLGGNDGVLAMGWGSGTANFTYLISPYEALQSRAREDRTTVSWFFDDFNTDMAGNYAKGKSVAIVFINSDSGEQYLTVDGNEGDRKNLTAWHGGDQLVLAAAAQNNNTIVVINSVGPMILESWIDHPNVTGVIWAGLGGNEAGNSIADVLYGKWNPSGRLPYTIAQRLEDYSAPLYLGGDETSILSIPYTEGLNIDYRGFDAKNITPRFEFGYGLSYSEFKYSNVKVKKIEANDDVEQDERDVWDKGGVNPIGQGMSNSVWLQQPLYNVTLDIENRGPYFGGDIPQLYVHFPSSAEEPPSLLKGFANVEADVGETKTVSIILSRYDLSIWDVEKQGWKKPKGTIRFSIGTSSRDLRLKGNFPA